MQHASRIRRCASGYLLRPRQRRKACRHLASKRAPHRAAPCLRSCLLSTSLFLLLQLLLALACAQRVLLPWKGACLACLSGLVSAKACSLQPSCMQYASDSQQVISSAKSIFTQQDTHFALVIK